MLLTSVHISLADVIDGDWCRADGKRMKIHGPEIVTPGGNQTRGDYTRHSFSYVIPAGEAGAGENVSIILLSEYLAHARQGSDTAPVSFAYHGLDDFGVRVELVDASMREAMGFLFQPDPSAG